MTIETFIHNSDINSTSVPSQQPPQTDWLLLYWLGRQTRQDIPTHCRVGGCDDAARQL